MQDTQQQPDPPTRFCPSCGAALRGAVAFCPSCGATLRATTGRLATEQVLAGRYRIVRLVARGGMGAVYRAEDMRLGGAPVAVKEMASSFVQGDTTAFARAVAEFQREAAMLARLRHPHLPRVSDQFDEAGKHYLVMEFIEGRTLSDTLRQAGGRLQLDRALDYADQLCDVLSYLHSQDPPIIYRDLKPSNVMVVSAGKPGSRGAGEQTQLVLIDFGIARFYRPGQAGDTAIYGTTGYAPPEQYGRGQTDARTDIYALGVLLHQLLTGHDPTSTPFALPPPRTLNATIPPHIAAAITRATASDRAARFADIAELRAALRPPESAAPEPSVVRRPARRTTQATLQPQALPPAAARRATSGLIWASAGIVGALLVGVLALALLRMGRTNNPTAPTAAPAIAAASTATTPLATAPANAAKEPASNTAAAIMPTVGSGGDSETPPPVQPGLVRLRPNQVIASGAADPGKDAEGNQVTYDPQNAVDGRPDTTWRVAGDGTEQWLELDFASEVSVQSIGIIPGYDKIDPSDNADRFAQNRVVKVARFEFSDGSKVRGTFSQQRDMQFISLPKAVRTRSIRIVIEETYPPPPPEQGGRDFTPISEVQAQGTP
jgi:serine/threonine-protein kinase